MSGHLTCVLTDIEGSTRLKRSDSRHYEAALASYHEFADRLISRFDGERVLARGEGDSMFITFPSAQHAVQFAALFQVQDSFGGLTLRTRMGIHTIRQDDFTADPYGEGPYLAARIRSTGSGGQTILSENTFAEVSETDLFRLRSLGGHSLVSYEDEKVGLWLLQPASGPELPLRIRSLSTVPNNLSAFRVKNHVGWDIADRIVERLLLERVLTLQLAPLSGHAQTLLRTAQAALAQFSSGVFVVRTWAEVTADPRQGTLYVLIDPVRITADLVMEVNQVTHSFGISLLLVSNTSNSRHGLATMDLDMDPLFQMTMHPKSREPYDVRELATDLEGKFGGKEAQRLMEQSPAMNSQLSPSWNLVTGWSGILTPFQCAVLTVLKQANASLSRVEMEPLLAYTTHESASHLTEALADLVEQRFLSTERSPTQELVYTPLQAGPLFGQSSLPPGFAHQLKELGLARLTEEFSAMPLLPGRLTDGAVFEANRWRVLLGELAEGSEDCEAWFLPALLAAGMFDQAARCAAQRESDAVGRYFEAAAQLGLQNGSAAEQILQHSVDEESPLVRGATMNLLGLARFRQGDWNGAHEAFSTALETFEELSNQDWVSKVCNNLGRVHHALGDSDRAEEFFQESLYDREVSGDWRGMAECENNLGAVWVQRGVVESGIPHFKRAASLYGKEAKDPVKAVTLSNLAYLLLDANRPAEARSVIEEGLELALRSRMAADIAIFRAYSIAVDYDLASEEFQFHIARAFEGALETADREAIHEAALFAARGLVAKGKTDLAASLCAFAGVSPSDGWVDGGSEPQGQVPVVSEMAAKRLARGFRSRLAESS